MPDSSALEPSRKSSRTPLRLLLFAAAGLLLAGALWGAFYFTHSGQPPQRPQKAPAATGPSRVSGVVKPVGPDLRTLALAVDQALYSALQHAGAHAKDLRITATHPLADPLPPELDERGAALARYHELSARTRLSPTDLAASLTKALAPAGGVAQVNVQEERITVLAYGVPLRSVHLLPLPPQKEQPVPLVRTPGTEQYAFKMAVVLDDLGDDLQYARQLLALPVPVTMAIWPYGRFAAQVADEAYAAGRLVMAHVPMEPMSYPRQNPGPGTLFASMSDEDLTATLAYNLRALPHIQGVNNHMGSRVTANKRAMKAILTELKARHLFFLDSVTTAKSQAIAAAKEVGITTFKRDVFLDNEQDVDKILGYLRRTEKIARKFGQAVAIGHPHPATLKALRIRVEERDQSIAIVPVTDLAPVVRPPAGAATNPYKG